MLWDFSSQIRKGAFRIRKVKKCQKKKWPAAPKYYLYFSTKILYDAHQFFDQSTVQMVTYVFLPEECTKYVQTMHNQFLSSLLLRVDLNPLKKKATSS